MCSRRYRPVVAVAVAILLASIVPLSGAPTDSGLVATTDAFHVVGYAALAVAIARADDDNPPFALVVAIAAATGYGAGIELLQATIPWRSLAAWDVLLNAVGAIAGAVSHRTWLRWRRRRRRRSPGRGERSRSE